VPEFWAAIVAVAIAFVPAGISEVVDKVRQSQVLLPPGPVQPQPPPEGVPLDETKAPIHFEGDRGSV
jgi:hypothetical protein